MYSGKIAVPPGGGGIVGIYIPHINYTLLLNYTHRHKKRLIMISLINYLEIIFVIIFLYYS
jgi:hypothetical protein